MTQPLPYGKVEWMGRQELDNIDIENYDRNGQKGYFLEVECCIPEYFHPLMSDFPPMPERMVVSNDILSNYQSDLKNKQGIKEDKSEKLLTTFMPKKSYKVI